MRLFTLRCANAVFTPLHLKLCELRELCVSFYPAFRQVRCAIGYLAHARVRKVREVLKEILKTLRFTKIQNR